MSTDQPLPSDDAAEPYTVADVPRFHWIEAERVMNRQAGGEWVRWEDVQHLLAPAPSADAAEEARACETCSGAGTIGQRLGGYGHSNPAALCPDCDGSGDAAPSPAPQPSEVERLRELLGKARAFIVHAADLGSQEAWELSRQIRATLKETGHGHG